jgi:hypothetical protein
MTTTQRSEPLACPDCAAVDEGSHLAHDDTCPIGRAIDEMSARDRDWFDRHPAATEHWRAAMPGDFSLPSLAGVVPQGRVRVRLIAPGVRVRQLPEVVLVLDDQARPTISQRHYLRLAQAAPYLPDHWLAELEGK